MSFKKTKKLAIGLSVLGISGAAFALTAVTNGTPLTADLMNEIINVVNGIDNWDDTNKILTVTGGIKHGNSSLACDSTNKGIIKFSGDSFYGCNSTSWAKLGN